MICGADQVDHLDCLLAVLPGSSAAQLSGLLSTGSATQSGIAASLIVRVARQHLPVVRYGMPFQGNTVSFAHRMGMFFTMNS